MKPPFAYYGGKQNLIPELLPLVPKHTQYCEIFCGGAALFWHKRPAKNEVLNDMDGNITNFYMQLKTNFEPLQKMIQGSLHSELLHKESGDVLRQPDADPVKRAWALWYQANCSFGKKLFSGFAFGTTGCGLNTANKRDAFTIEFSNRLRNTEIFSRNALDLLELKDNEDTFFYVDPPYVSSDCGHYKGYTMDNFAELLERLSKIKGKFLLSSYPEAVLMECREKYGWYSKDIKQQVLVDNTRKEPKFKTECLTWNYALDARQVSIFDELTTNTESHE